MAFAFVFPGQGSQSVGMMAAYMEAADDAALVRDTFEEASRALGEDLWSMVDSGTAEQLAQTVNTQPIMLTADVAVWRLWRKRSGSLPAVMAGHSLGEYAALVAADVISFADAVPLVRLRAAAMQAAVPLETGMMAAIMGLDAEAIAAACAESAQGEVVEAVNFNAQGQIVIAGHRAAVERAMGACKAKGAKRALPLSVSAPFHSSLMRPAAEKLADALSGISLRPPAIPVINNVDVADERDPERIREALIRQVYGPVRWVEVIHRMASLGARSIVECGPGKVLAGLAKRCSSEVSGVALDSAGALEAYFNLEREAL
ncbi:MAG: ACP S-malonyltransferase [Zoogloeaceae bacterium]|jgi:[acyl-carrier-protein] S-malonyltransferase|nr:ACP S-malonyltransferase [Zoogloeaceae bacterium]